MARTPGCAFAFEFGVWTGVGSLERILPPRRERPVRFNLPKLQSPSDAAAAMAAIAAGVADGNLTPSEAGELSKLVDAYVKALDASDFDQRLRAIEAKGDATRP